MNHDASPKKTNTNHEGYLVGIPILFLISFKEYETNNTNIILSRVHTNYQTASLLKLYI